MGNISDYGGNRYRRRGGGKCSKLRKENTRSYYCLSCGKLFYLTLAQTARVTSSRCPHCGGTGEETEASFKRRSGMTKKSAAKLTGNLGTVIRGQLAVLREYKPFLCSGCGKAFRSEVAMRLHAEENHAATGEAS